MDRLVSQRSSGGTEEKHESPNQHSRKHSCESKPILREVSLPHRNRYALTDDGHYKVPRAKGNRQLRILKHITEHQVLHKNIFTEKKIGSLNNVGRIYILNIPSVVLSRLGHEAVYTGKQAAEAASSSRSPQRFTSRHGVVSQKTQNLQQCRFENLKSRKFRVNEETPFPFP